MLGRAPTPAQAARLSLSKSALRSKPRGDNAISTPALSEIQAALRLNSSPPRRSHRGVRSHHPRNGRHHRRTQPPNRDLEAKLATHFETHPDADIYLSLPGLGVMLGARVLGEFGDDPDRFTDAKSRKNYAGTSPLTVASGKKHAVLARHVRNRRLYDAIDQWAFCALSASPGARYLLRPTPRRRRHPPPSPTSPRQPTRRHPARLPTPPHALQRTHRLGPPHRQTDTPLDNLRTWDV